MKPKQILTVVLALNLLIMGFVSVGVARAWSPAKNLKPISYSPQSGTATGSILSLKVNDQTGTQNDPSKYVLFSTPSVVSDGFFTYTFPSAKIALATVTSLQVRVNFRGPRTTIQRWTWKLYDWKSNSWVMIGDNAAVKSNAWTLLTFDVKGNLSRFVNLNQEIHVQLVSSNTSKNAKIDMQLVRIIYQASCGETVNSTYETQVFNLINDERTSRGLSTLTRDSRLDTAAHLHSADMACSNYFSHDSQDGTTPWERIERQGYNFLGAAENIAAGYVTPEAVVAGWMNSQGHRDNILNPDLTQIGIGYAYTSASDWGSYWTTDFASPAP